MRCASLWIALALAAVLTAPTLAVHSGKPLVVTSTAVLGSVVEDLANGSVDVYVLVSPSVCPAHYDVRPSDVYVVSKADLILYHGFEPWVKGLVNATRSRAPIVRVSGSWNTPEGLKEYYAKVGEALMKYLGINVSSRLGVVIKEIDEVSRELRKESVELGCSGVNVIAMGWQEGFVKWLGFNVVDTTPPPEKLTVKDLEELVEKGRELGVSVVVDNLQSGEEFGRSLASRLGAIHVVLTNFPGTGPELRTVLDVLKHNAEKMFDAVRYLKYSSEEVSKLRGEVSLYRPLTYVATAVAAAEAVAIAYLLATRGGRE